MKRFSLFVLAPLVFAALVSVAFAGNFRQCGVVPGQSHYQFAPASFVEFHGSLYQPGVSHRRRVDVVQIQTVAQINPAYVSTYSPDGYDATTQADILQELRQMRFRMDQVQAQLKFQGPVSPAKATDPAPVMPQASDVPGPRPVKPQGVAVGLSVLQTKCAACHQVGKLTPEQRFTILDSKGSLMPLQPQQKLRILGKAYFREMPPPGNLQGIPELTDAEYAAVVDLLR